MCNITKKIKVVLTLIIISIFQINLSTNTFNSKKIKAARSLAATYFLLSTAAFIQSIKDLNDSFYDSNNNLRDVNQIFKNLITNYLVDVGSGISFLYCSKKLAEYKPKNINNNNYNYKYSCNISKKDKLQNFLEGAVSTLCAASVTTQFYRISKNLVRCLNGKPISNNDQKSFGIVALIAPVICYTLYKSIPHSYKSFKSLLHY